MESAESIIAQAYEDHLPAVYRYCLRMTGSVQDAEDLSQETFLAAYNGYSKFKHHCALKTWLLSIAHNKVSSHIRRKKLEQLFNARVNPLKFEEPMLLECLVLQLNPKHREAFVLTKIEGLSTEEAALALGIPTGTVKYHVYQAVVQLQESLNQSMSEEPQHVS